MISLNANYTSVVQRTRGDQATKLRMQAPHKPFNARQKAAVTWWGNILQIVLTTMRFTQMLTHEHVLVYHGWLLSNSTLNGKCCDLLVRARIWKVNVLNEKYIHKLPHDSEGIQFSSSFSGVLIASEWGRVLIEASAKVKMRETKIKKGQVIKAALPVKHAHLLCTWFWTVALFFY